MTEDRVALHEEKRYYPDMDQVYPDAENLVMEEDVQHISEPIVKPIENKNFDIIEKTVDLNFDLEFL